MHDKLSDENVLFRPSKSQSSTRTGIEGSDDEALDTGQDEEVSRWEQEQIRKGISIPQVTSHDAVKTDLHI